VLAVLEGASKMKKKFLSCQFWEYFKHKFGFYASIHSFIHSFLCSAPTATTTKTTTKSMREPSFVSQLVFVYSGLLLHLVGGSEANDGSFKRQQIGLKKSSAVAR